ncbi:acyl-CoA dehydrogenase family protein [Bradyrhizobium sp. DASA03007]|uniref:acyl-CoA dehydrogenase family protein n=1 Tax=unclassified Bradyrhizobium TaxID=2631580 RepID=UPI003F6F4F4F
MTLLAVLSGLSTKILKGLNATLTKDGDGWTLNDMKSLVLHGAAADKIVVSAWTAGTARDKDGVGLFLIKGNAPGVTPRLSDPR